MKDYSLSNWKTHYEDLPKKTPRKVEPSENAIETIEAMLGLCFIILILLGTYLWFFEVAINAGVELGEVWKSITN